MKRMIVVKVTPDRKGVCIPQAEVRVIESTIRKWIDDMVDDIEVMHNVTVDTRMYHKKQKGGYNG